MKNLHPLSYRKERQTASFMEKGKKGCRGGDTSAERFLPKGKKRDLYDEMTLVCSTKGKKKNIQTDRAKNDLGSVGGGGERRR